MFSDYVLLLQSIAANKGTFMFQKRKSLQATSPTLLVKMTILRTLPEPSVSPFGLILSSVAATHGVFLFCFVFSPLFIFALAVAAHMKFGFS